MWRDSNRRRNHTKKKRARATEKNRERRRLKWIAIGRGDFQTFTEPLEGKRLHRKGQPLIKGRGTIRGDKKKRVVKNAHWLDR